MQHVDEHSLVKTVFDSQLLEHPLPWRVERDWAYEVKASDDVVIAKCASSSEAEAIVSLANGRKTKR